MKNAYYLTLGVLTLGGQSALSQSKESKQPNFIVIISDDQGYGGLNCYPHTKRVITPNIDQLAANGIQFMQGYTSGHVSSPTRAGLMTGKYQQSFGFYGLSEPHVGGIPTSETILPQYLKRSGYKTGMVGKWHLGDFERTHPINMGFDYFYGFISGQHDYFNPVVGHSWEGGSDGLCFMMEGKEPVASMKYSTYEFTDRSVDFINRNANEPFFLYLAYNAIHGPLQAPEELVRKYADNPVRPTIDDKVRAMTVALDEGVGQVIKSLKQNNIYENTVIIYLSDNGGATFSDNWILRGSKGSYYEGGIRVPFIMSWPARLPKGIKYNHPVMSIDIAPTILSITGKPQDEMHGVNLIPFLKGEKNGAPHEVLFWSVALKSERIERNEFAVRQGKWKLVSDPRIEKDYNLYDIENDPGEKNGLKEKYPEKYEELFQIYLDWIGEMPPSLLTRENRRLNGNSLIKQYNDKVKALKGKKPLLTPGGYIVP